MSEVRRKKQPAVISAGPSKCHIPGSENWPRVSLTPEWTPEDDRIWRMHHGFELEGPDLVLRPDWEETAYKSEYTMGAYGRPVLMPEYILGEDGRPVLRPEFVMGPRGRPMLKPVSQTGDGPPPS
jgi:hypothetical protein